MKSLPLGLILALGLSLPESGRAADPNQGTAAQGEIVAKVGETLITDSMVERRAADRLTKIRSEEYAVKKQVLDEYIVELLLQQEALLRGISVDELQKVEIASKVAPVTEDAKRAVLETNPQQFQGRRKMPWLRLAPDCNAHEKPRLAESTSLV